MSLDQKKKGAEEENLNNIEIPAAVSWRPYHGKLFAIMHTLMQLEKIALDPKY